MTSAFPMVAYIAPRPRGVWHSTAALVVEIVSPGDESWKKSPVLRRPQCG